MAGVWSSSETMPEQKTELQNVKKKMSVHLNLTFHYGIMLQILSNEK